MTDNNYNKKLKTLLRMPSPVPLLSV